MGSRTDARIAAFQEQTGIKPARGDRAISIKKLQDACFEAIRIMELERSGIRDGNGFWTGSDVVGAICSDLIAAAETVAYGAPRDRAAA